MLDFIQKIIENPQHFSEDEKYEMLIEGNKKDVSAKELAEIVRFVKSKQIIEISLPDSIDIVGTGGSGLSRINTSTLASLKLAQKGHKVVKHGNNAGGGRFGSFDLIEHLNYKIPNNRDEILEEYIQNNIAFLHAKKFYPFFKEFAGVRKRYVKPTIFNILGPLLNFANVDYVVSGCSFAEKMELMIETYKILGVKNVLLVRGEDGLDEVTLAGKTLVYELQDGEIKKYYISAEDFGFVTCKPEEILTEKIEDKIRVAEKIIAGEKVGRYSDLVDLNVRVSEDFMIRGSALKGEGFC